MRHEPYFILVCFKRFVRTCILQPTAASLGQNSKRTDLRVAAISNGFFFQAEDGMRDADVTGVQTCALPIFTLGLIDRMAGWLGRPCMDALARSDLRWLAARTDPHRLAELSEGLLGKEATRLLLDIVSGEPSYRLLRALKRRAIPPLSAYRTDTPAGAVVRRRIRMGVGLAVALNRRILRSLVIPGRTLSSGGLVIVFEGEDENERATLVDRIAAWLTWKLDVLVLHGRPRNSRATRRKAFRARSRGMIVLYDGFPEGQRRDTGNAPERAWDADPPDLVINLRRAPRPEPEGHTEVVTREGRPTRHNVDIDLDHSPEQVLLAVQRALWQEV